MLKYSFLGRRIRIIGNVNRIGDPFTELPGDGARIQGSEFREVLHIGHVFDLHFVSLERIPSQEENGNNGQAGGQGDQQELGGGDMMGDGVMRQDGDGVMMQQQGGPIIMNQMQQQQQGSMNIQQQQQNDGVNEPEGESFGGSEDHSGDGITEYVNDEDEDEYDEDWADAGPYNFVDWSDGISQESDIDEDIFYKAIDEDKINEFEQKFYAALSCQKSSDAKRKDMHEAEDDDNERHVKKTK